MRSVGRRWTVLWSAVTALVVGAAAQGSALAAAEPISLQELLTRPKVVMAKLSPDGHRMAVLLRETRRGLNDGSSLWIHELDPTPASNAPPVHLMRSKTIDDLHWSMDGTVIFLEVGESLGRISAAGGRPSWLHKLDRDRKQRFAGVDPTRPRHLWVRESLAAAGPDQPERYRLLRLDERGGEETLLESPEPITSWLLDDSGQVGWVKQVVRTADGQVDGQALIRQSGRESRPLVRCSVTDPCGWQSRSGRTAWMRARFEEDLWALHSIDLETGERVQAHRDPEGRADLGQVVVDPTSQRPILVTYETDRLRLYGLGAEMERHARRVRDRFAAGSVEIQAREDGPFWLIRERAPRLHHPRYWIYATADGSFREVLTEERGSIPSIGEDRLADQLPVTYRASDGMRIHGYVWLPSGVDLASAPVVANIHGGPWNRIHYGFSSTAQFLVSRGYVVFQPNFRGSSGYGYRYLAAAHGELSRSRVQQDILDGLNDLSAKGWGAPDRRAIAGHSYGGYAALVAGVYRASEYRAAVATASPIDLVRSFLDMDPEETTRNGIPFKRWARDLFVDLDDPQAVSEERRRAPEANARSLGVPLLLMAASRDVKVDVVDVKHFASVAREHGKDVTFLVDDEAGHSFETPHMRAASIVLMERFLGVHLDVPTIAVDLDPDLEQYIEQRLLSVGKGMAP